MANFPFLLIVGVSIFAKCILAQNATCAPGAPRYCSCTLLSSGIGLECSGYSYTPENIKSDLEFYKPYGPIVSLRVTEIWPSLNNYVPDDFLSGNQIPAQQRIYGYVINFKMNMTKFSEEVFLAPLQTSGLIINLNPNSRFLCGCRISWLIRDNRALLNHVNNGNCSDGRPFQSIPAEEVSCCSNESLLLRIDRLQKENDNLKAKRNSKCLRKCPTSLPAQAQTV